MAEDLAQVLALLTQLTSQLKTTQDEIAELKAAKSTPVAEKKQVADPAVQALLDEQAETIKRNNETMNKFFSDQRKEKLTAAAKDGLIKRGIDSKRVDLALSVLKDNLKVDKTGKFSFADPQLGDIDLDEGLTRFAESENGGVFKAPVDVNGTGTASFQQNPLLPGQFVKRSNGGFDVSRAKYKEDGTMEDNDFTRLIASTIGIS